jgi:tetratricopeptide (TPR) repeat protein
VKNRTFFFRLSLIGLAVATPLLTGCNYLRARVIKEAFRNYQEAAASGDLIRTEVALAALVKADEDVPDYWVELGKVELQLGNYSKAYDAFAHAHELDRTDVPILATLTQLAVMSGQADLADEHARSLALLAPDNPTVALVRSYTAFKSGNLDEADAQADKLLADDPNNSNAKALKAHILVARNRLDDAIALLEDQQRAVPDDRAALRQLAALYRSRNDWRNAARVQFALCRLDPKDTAVASALVEALLRADDVVGARRVSAPLLSAAADPKLVDATLVSWARYAPTGQVLPYALAEASAGASRIAFASYFNRVGKPAAAAALLGGTKLPVSPGNSRWNAVIAQSLALQGRSAEAKRLFDLVLLAEPDDVEALRGRSALEAKTRMTKQAIVDAQRLVSATPKTGEDRLLLAEAYLAAGQKREVARVLWQAFQELPDDERVLAALKSVLVSTGDVDGERRLNNEALDRRMAKLTKDLV